MAFGRAVLVREAGGDADAELLQDALSLLGYDEPASSPCGALLSAKARLQGALPGASHSPVSGQAPSMSLDATPCCL